jgi:hypothetical protein
MRTKTLLLTAALSAAGVASSMAQGTVFSVNAVGYVNTTVNPGFAIIANPLTASDNSIQSLFGNGIQGTIPDGFSVYRFTGTGFAIAQYSAFDGTFSPTSVASQSILPGEGVFVKNPSTSPVTITFVGEVSQGNLVNAYPKGLSLKASQVPQEAPVDTMGFKGQAGDQIYMFNTTTQKYVIYTVDSFSGVFDPPLPALKVGEGFFLKAGAAGSWNRTFSVNTP